MKGTIKRSVDDVGRFVLPIEVRRSMGLKDKDKLELIPQDGGVFLRKYQPGCNCGCTDPDKLIFYQHEYVCQDCVARMWGEVQKQKQEREAAGQ